MKSKILFFLFAAVLFVSSPTSAHAQSISLTSPTVGQVLPAGDDFATDVLNQPWDGSQRRMIAWEENFVGTSVAATGGVWRGTNESQGGYVFPLFPGFRALFEPDPMPGDKTLPKLGARWPINANKYSRLAYRLNHTSRSSLAVYWESNPNKAEYWPDPNSPRGAKYDGVYHGSGLRNSGFVVYDFDMKNLAGNFDSSQGSWSGNIYALRFDPSLVGPAGSQTEIDWIRLVDPTSAPNVTVTWNASGLNSTHVVSVYLDNNNSGYDGSQIVRFVNGNNPGTYTFPSAILPPGNHFLYVEVRAASGGAFTGSPIRTAYSGQITVTHKPEVIITSPSTVSGEEYAVKTFNNTWDMDPSGADVSNLPSSGLPQILRQWTNGAFVAFTGALGGHVFQALAEAPYPGNSESDAQVHMRISPINSIDPDYFRYVTYRMAADASQYPTIADKVRRGWVTRMTSWNSNIVSDGMYGRAHVLYEGWNTYTYDMADENTFETGKRWQDFYRLPNMRIDVLETDVPTWFWIDYVKLNAENRTPNNTFAINFTLADPDSTALNVGIYYDTDNVGFNGTLIAQLNGLARGTHTRNWNTTSLPNNTPYWIYFVVSDGTSTRRTYSSVHVRTGRYVAGPQPRLGGTVSDYDGDSRSDQSVYRSFYGQFFFNQSTAGYELMPWGNAAFRPIQGDFDGDGRTDRGLVGLINGNYIWYYIRSGDLGLVARYWGLTGDHLVIGDYNGNGRDEIAVYRPANGGWFVLDEQDGVTVRYWGLPGDLPTPADYDGDGKADLAIFRPSDGNWWVINSGFATGFTQTQFRLQQWGLPGDVPVIADWDSDSKADFGIFRPATGMWWVRNGVSNAITAQQWGLAGDIPRAGGDYNGDGRPDFTVYRQGIWYHNYGNGQIGVVGFGLPGDFLPEKTTLYPRF